MKLQKIAFLPFIFFAFTTFSQTEKGQFYMGANSNINASFISYYSKSDTSPSQKRGENRAFSISPKIGFFIINNLVLGADLSLSFNVYKPNGVKGNENSISLGPFAKYYFLEDSFKPFVSAKYSLGRYNRSYDYLDEDPDNGIDKRSLTNLQIGGGIAYFLHNSVSLASGIHYLRTTNKSLDDNRFNLTDINAGFTSSFSFAIFI